MLACLGDTDVCHVCGTEFQARLAVIAHLSEFRIRSKVRGTCCGIEYAKASPPPLSASIAEALNCKDRERRREAGKKAA